VYPPPISETAQPATVGGPRIDAPETVLVYETNVCFTTGMTTNAAATVARPTRAIAYVRVSTTEQSESGLGLDAQRALITAELARRGWELVAERCDVASGKSTNGRPELAAALAELDAGAADVLVVARLDRLSRSTLDTASTLARAERRGWALVALDLGLDTTSPAGRLMVSVLAGVAEYERAAIADRTRRALAAKRDAGHRLGRPVALPQAVRDRIAAERAAGATLRAIGAGLERDGIATAQGGAQWWPATVRAVWRSTPQQHERRRARAARTLDY
jgi:DNA invertase Pin-like site-specific DNA recombinase